MSKSLSTLFCRFQGNSRMKHNLPNLRCRGQRIYTWYAKVERYFTIKFSQDLHLALSRLTWMKQWRGIFAVKFTRKNLHLGLPIEICDMRGPSRSSRFPSETNKSLGWFKTLITWTWLTELARTRHCYKFNPYLPFKVPVGMKLWSMVCNYCPLDSYVGWLMTCELFTIDLKLLGPCLTVWYHDSII